ncbi:MULTISPECIES: VOC family protein [unclassified Novosphingobium]|uniref:VOC family protein n=1 Tax=unclassified Novosphingobium TaxID=2644732 RepID=UPI000868ADA1|nr:MULTISPECIES: VOC family protein [unclassified Novosphingobium]MDR6708645.1 glyoxylase I family protein [Novosphingobium sp. 1748]NKI97986.1 glyoxylase I family protein [Novosphingobium sp. SG707]ODU82000.1 MAG: glyoxalase [Novosphingobium sp. SCN 63-17]OJX96723.1 MAG: glyoxalase [Novosphingobium sp. 63-713]
MTEAIPPRPHFSADHVSWTVADAEAVARFYIDVFGASELFRMGPIDAADIPPMPDGRDWMAAHVNVPGARLTLIMLRLTETLNFQLVQYDKPDDRSPALPRNCDAGGHHLGLRVDDVPAAAAYLAAHGCTAMEIIEISEGPLAGKKNLYLLDPWGHQLEIVD